MLSYSTRYQPDYLNLSMALSRGCEQIFSIVVGLSSKCKNQSAKVDAILSLYPYENKHQRGGQEQNIPTVLFLKITEVLQELCRVFEAYENSANHNDSPSKNVGLARLDAGLDVKDDSDL